MELTTLLGIIVGLLSIVGAMIFKHISFSVFLNPAAILVIFVGTAAAVLNSYPGQNLKSLGALFKILFTKQKMITEAEIIELMIELSETAKKEGFYPWRKKWRKLRILL
jgi:chemotaxis protein MotA